jgi:hypothetical protein
MKIQKPSQPKAPKVRAALVRFATAGATLCTTLMVLGVFDGGTGPKVPPAQGE